MGGLIKTIDKSPVQENNSKNSAHELFQYFLANFDYDQYLSTGLDEDTFFYAMSYFEKLFKTQGEIRPLHLQVMLSIEHYPKTAKEIALEINESPRAVPRILHYLALRGFLSSSKTKNKSEAGSVYHVLNQYGRQRLFEEIKILKEQEEKLGVKLL